MTTLTETPSAAPRARHHTVIDWDQIDTALLDMDGVLLDLRYDNFFWREHVPSVYAKLRGLDLAQAESEIFPRYRAAEGSLDWYCIDYWSDALGLDIAALKESTADRIRVRPRVEEFLLTIRGFGIDLRLVTNAHRETLDIKMRHTGLARYFDRVICSHDYGAPKEQSRFWRDFHQAAPFTPTRALFVDDSVPILRSARRFGIGTLLCISQPDSGQDQRTTAEFHAIDCFSELLPSR